MLKMRSKLSFPSALQAFQLSTRQIPLSPPGPAGRRQFSVSLAEVPLQHPAGGGLAPGWLHPLNVEG